ncbi:MAG: thioesterase family protein [Rhodococcus sp. (in: high G+C Gram-positive bacteria)]
MTTLTQVGPDCFDGSIDATWTIGPKVHGGAMTSICAAAATQRLAQGDDPVELTPLAVSASYLAAPDPGPITVETSVIKRGRRVVHVDAVLLQSGRPAVRSIVTLGTPDERPPVHQEHQSSLASVLDMSVEPSEAATRVASGHPMADIVHVAKGCDMRLDPAAAHFLSGDTGEAEIRMWVRPQPGDESDPGTAALFAIMAGDICPPVTMNRGVFGWAPTVQLTTYLRRRPVPGWLRVKSASTVVGGTWFEEDHTVVDASGAVVVQSRQLAMVPLAQ